MYIFSIWHPETIERKPLWSASRVESRKRKRRGETQYSKLFTYICLIKHLKNKTKMHNWFECKISYDKVLENGMQKKVTEPYLVDALSFTEAEARIIEEIRPFISGEFTVTDIKRARISEIFFNENGDRYYKIKVFYITLDEKSGAEKKTAAMMLAQACTLKEALGVLEEGMKGTLSDYTVASIAETMLMDVFPFDADSIPSAPKTGEELIAEQKKAAENK